MVGLGMSATHRGSCDSLPNPTENILHKSEPKPCLLTAQGHRREDLRLEVENAPEGDLANIRVR